jgi:hypothetical protein
MELSSNTTNMIWMIRGAIRRVPSMIAVSSMLLSFTTVHGRLADDLRVAPPCRARTLDLRAYATLIGTEYTCSLDLSNDLATWSWTDYGDNSLYVYPRDPSINDEYIFFSTGSSPSNLGEIGNNYWGPNIDPGSGSTCSTNCHWNTTSSSKNDAYDVQYTNANNNTYHVPVASCGDNDGFVNKSPKVQPESIKLVEQDSCHILYAKAQSYSQNQLVQKEFDTLKKFITSCPFDPNVPRAFNQIASASALILPKDSMVWVNFRYWLISMLYANTVDPNYFCECVRAISGTFYYPSDTGRAILHAINLGLAVDQWLLLNTSCDTPYLWQDYQGSRWAQRQSWLNDTSLPLDTTLPSMHELGLDTVLAKHFILNSAGSIEHILTSAIASPNPAKEGVVITFGLAKSSYVHIQLYDVLGTEVSSSHFEALFETGNQAVPISLHDLPSGTYYARIITSPGDSRTVKLVKE